MAGNFGGAPVPFTGQVYQPDNSIPQLILQAGAQRAALEQNLYRGIGDSFASLGQIPGQMQALAMQKQEMGLKAAQEARAQAQADRENAALQNQAGERQALGSVAGPGVTAEDIQNRLAGTQYAYMIPQALKNKQESDAAVEEGQQHIRDQIGGELFRSVAPWLDKPEMINDGLQLAATHLKTMGIDSNSIDQTLAQAQAHPEAARSIVTGLIGQSKWDKQFQETYNKTQTVGGNIVRQSPSGQFQTLYTAPISAEKQAELAIEGGKLAEERRHNVTEENLKAFDVGGGMPIPGINAPAQSNAPITPGATDLHGDKYLASLPPQQADLVKAFAEGRLSLPQGRALKANRGLMNAVIQYDPSLQGSDYDNRAKVRGEFMDPGSKTGQSINALNTVSEHLSGLQDAMRALGNTGSPDVNTLKNLASAHSGEPEVTNYNQYLSRVSEELTKFYRANGGSEKDVDRDLATYDSSMSPPQQQGALKATANMILGKLSAYEQQRDSALGKSGRDLPVATPQTRLILNQLMGGQIHDYGGKKGFEQNGLVYDAATGQLIGKASAD